MCFGIKYPAPAPLAPDCGLLCTNLHVPLLYCYVGSSQSKHLIKVAGIPASIASHPEALNQTGKGYLTILTSIQICGPLLE